MAGDNVAESHWLKMADQARDNAQKLGAQSIARNHGLEGKVLAEINKTKRINDTFKKAAGVLDVGERALRTGAVMIPAGVDNTRDMINNQ